LLIIRLTLIIPLTLPAGSQVRRNLRRLATAALARDLFAPLTPCTPATGPCRSPSRPSATTKRERLSANDTPDDGVTYYDPPNVTLPPARASWSWSSTPRRRVKVKRVMAVVELLELARRLSAQGEPFVMATVVWRRAPTSGRAGAKAIVRADGRMEGWLGGACSADIVAREGRRALEEGTPRLMFLDSQRSIELPPGDGLVSMPMGCVSEGGLGIYLEPVLPTPRLVAIGRTPVVDALAGMARAVGWRAVVVDEEGGVDDHPWADEVLSSRDLMTSESYGGSSFVVVASMGHDDEGLLEAALASPAAYVGLVASARRAKSVLDVLRQRGVSEDDLGRIHAPAGLDFGHLATREIAVAIVAQILALRDEGRLGPAPGTATPAQEAQETKEAQEAVDPVCGMTVSVAGARHRTTHEGREYFFCCAGCQTAFEADPAAFAPR